MWSVDLHFYDDDEEEVDGGSKLVFFDIDDGHYEYQLQPIWVIG